MRALPPGLQAHLDSGTTTLCWCWRVTRRDGVSFGFTDHDRDLDFDSTTFEAATGFTASEIKDQVGLSVDNLEVTSALVSDRLSETALATGDFDDAKVEIFRVNWSEPSQHVRVRTGSIGEVRRSGVSFTAEVRGLAHYLQQPSGRLFQYGCDAEIGDSRCGVDLSTSQYRGDGTVTETETPRLLIVAGLDDFDADWFTRGLVTFTSGANAGRSIEVKRHSMTDDVVEIELWQSLPVTPTSGDAFTITAGCDKTFPTCRARFSNGLNFRGFPHMPGNDFIASYPRSDHLSTDGEGA
jgi:uncharacterized phage protein (TIGR02218 family)